jgi:enterobacteria phage integrase
MAPRRRSHAKRNWPDNLYERDGYFSWKNPLDGREYGIGRDRTAAFEEAREANLHVAIRTDKARVVHKLTGEADRTVGAWATRYEGILAAKKLSPNTRKMYKSCGKRLVDELGAETLMSAVTPLRISDLIDGIAETMPRRAIQVRGYAREFFRVAAVKGWVNESPVRDLGEIRATVKRARLTLEVFRQVYDTTSFVWLRNAMALALVSAQRREDIATFETTDWRDGGWYCEQGKGHPDKGGAGRGGRKIFIPGSLRLDCFGMSLEDVYKQCRATRVFTKHVIHHTVHRGEHCKRGDPLHMDTLTVRFHDEVLRLGIDWGEKEPPSFHEIRSLSERLYAAQGGIDTSDLLGHKDKKTTETYHDTRGSEWLRITVGRAG